VGLFGAAGAAGQIIGAALSAAGRDYRVVGRSRAPLEAAFGHDPHAEIVTWNPDDPASISAAAAGLQTVIYLVGVPYDQFASHPPLMQKTLDGVTAAGVERFILIGTVYPYGARAAIRLAKIIRVSPIRSKARCGSRRKIWCWRHTGARAGRPACRRWCCACRISTACIERSLLNGVFEGAAHGKRAQVLGPVDVPHEFIYLPGYRPGGRETHTYA
jgi:Nucleoside-diphosphate-sugar epimerases